MTDYPMDGKEFALHFDRLYLSEKQRIEEQIFLRRFILDRYFFLQQGIVCVLSESFGFANCYRIIDAYGIYSVTELIGYSADEICSIKGIGPKRLALLRSSLADYGLTLKRHTLQRTIRFLPLP